MRDIFIDIINIYLDTYINIWNLDLFHISDNVNSIRSVWKDLNSFKCITRNGIAESHGNSIFSFLGDPTYWFPWFIYHFTSPIGVSKYTSFTMSSPKFLVVCILHESYCGCVRWNLTYSLCYELVHILHHLSLESPTWYM